MKMQTIIARAVEIRIAPILLMIFFLFLGCSGETDAPKSSHEPEDDDGHVIDHQDDDDDDNDDNSDSSPGIYDDLAPQGPVIGEILGYAAQMNGNAEDEWKRSFELSTLAEAGLSHVRNGFSWSVVEPSDNVWVWDETDVLRDAAIDHGFFWDARLAYETEWAAPDGSPSSIEPDDFADYASHVAERYCDEIRRYEIWNEPNFYHFWGPEPDPAHYGLLLKAAYDAIHEVCPEAEVLFGGLAPANFSQEWHSGTYPFFDRVARAHPDICEYFDLMAIHPYTVFQEVRPEFSAQLFGMSYPDLPGQVDDIRDRMEKAGCAEKPVLFSEFGWPSTFIGQRRQAAYLVRAVLLGTMKEVLGYYLYTFWDKTGRTPVTENDFGLYEFSESTDPDEQIAKEAFSSIKTLGRMVKGVRYAGDLSEVLHLPADVYVLAFVKEDFKEILLAAWDGRGGESSFDLSLPLHPSASRVQGFGLTGDEIPLAGTDVIAVHLDGNVTYLQFELE